MNQLNKIYRKILERTVGQSKTIKISTLFGGQLQLHLSGFSTLWLDTWQEKRDLGTGGKAMGYCHNSEGHPSGQRA